MRSGTQRSLLPQLQKPVKQMSTDEIEACLRAALICQYQQLIPKYIGTPQQSFHGGFDGFVYIEVIIGFKQYYYQKEGLPTIAVASLSCWEIIGYSCPSKKVRVVAIIELLFGS